MEQNSNCAYNRTRGCFLGVEIAAGEFNAARLTYCLDRLTSKCGFGMWMIPFRGLRAEDVSSPIDLIYLNEECHVIETVEFFPTLRASEKCASAASLLALPAHSILSSHTQPGDRILLSTPEVMSTQLEQESQNGAGLIPSAPSAAHSLSATSPASSKRGTSSSGRRDSVRKSRKTEGRSTGQTSVATQAVETETLSLEPSGRIVAPPKNWLERWLFPEPAEPRSAERKPAPGLIAHFWTGGTPQSHPVRDISSTGLYVETTERWYPGTLIRMTLSKLNPGHEPAQCSIVLQCRSIRWGDDGVGVEFVFENAKRSRKESHSLLEAVNAKHLQDFLKRLRDDRTNA